MKSILIVVDMQNGFIKQGQLEQLTDKITNLLERRIFDAVIATKFLNGKNSTYEKLFGWYSLESEDERNIPERIMKHVDFVTEKYTYNCVTSSFIQRLCQLNDGTYPKEVFIVGVDTDCCVLAIATALFEYNIRPIVLTRYVDSNGGTKYHKAGILCLERLIGKGQLSDSELLTSEDIVFLS